MVFLENIEDQDPFHRIIMIKSWKLGTPSSSSSNHMNVKVSIRGVVSIWKRSDHDQAYHSWPCDVYLIALEYVDIVCHIQSWRKTRMDCVDMTSFSPNRWKWVGTAHTHTYIYIYINRNGNTPGESPHDADERHYSLSYWSRLLCVLKTYPGFTFEWHRFNEI